MKRIALIMFAAVLGIASPVAAQAPGPGGEWGRFYLRGEYLLWWMKDSPAPVPLVAASPSPGANVLLGGEDINVGHIDGMRITAGYWFNDDRVWGVEMSGLYLPPAVQGGNVASTGTPGSPNLVVPFVDPTLPGQNSTPLSLAGSFSGEARERLTTNMWGIEASALAAVSSSASWRMEALGGFRYLRLAEGYSFATSSPDLPGGPTTVFQTQDIFEAGNDFYGAQIGLRGRYQSKWWLADATLKVAVGAMNQSVDIAGSLVTNQFTAPALRSFIGGYFAQPTNIGSHSRTVVAVVPELGVNVGFRLGEWASVYIGGTFLYASNVVRPANQIDRNINPTQSPSFGGPIPTTLVGEASPSFKFRGSDFWAYGLNVGLGLSF